MPMWHVYTDDIAACSYDSLANRGDPVIVHLNIVPLHSVIVEFPFGRSKSFVLALYGVNLLFCFTRERGNTHGYQQSGPGGYV